jgi:hypothetical protein
VAAKEPSKMAEELPPDDESRPRFRRHSAPDGWLRDKLEASDKIRSNPDLFFNDNVTKDARGARRIGGDEGITASYTKDVHLPPEMLIEIQGASGEGGHRGLSGNQKLEDLRESIAKEGYNIEGRPILVKVREDGTPFVVEGNHRLFEAWSSNRPTIPVSLEYKRGGEEAEGPLSPGRIERLGRYTDDALLSLELSKLSEEAGKSRKDVLAKGVGSLMRRSFPGLAAQAAQLGYQHLLSDEQREGIKNFLNSPLTETSGLESLKEKLGISDDDLPIKTPLDVVEGRKLKPLEEVSQSTIKRRLRKAKQELSSLTGIPVKQGVTQRHDRKIKSLGKDNPLLSKRLDNIVDRIYSLKEMVTPNPLYGPEESSTGSLTDPLRQKETLFDALRSLPMDQGSLPVSPKDVGNLLANLPPDKVRAMDSLLKQRDGKGLLDLSFPGQRTDMLTYIEPGSRPSDEASVRGRIENILKPPMRIVDKANGGFVDKPLYDNPRGGYI